MSSWKRELRPTWWLAFPMIVGNLGQMMLGLVDTLMIGWIGTVELGAAAFANAIMHFAFVVGIGISVAVSVQVAHAHGRKDDHGAGEALRHGAFLTLISGLVLAVLVTGAMPFYGYLGQPEAVIEKVPSYLNWLGLSLIPGLAGMSFKAFSEAKGSPWVVFWIMMGGVGLNVLLNWMLIFGNLGAPALGLEGAGIATFLARVATMVGLIVYVLRAPAFAAARPRWWQPLRLKELRLLLMVGVPMGLQIFIEIGAFGFATLLIGTLGTVPLAAHQIAINCAGMSFMVPLGISMACTIRVGQCVGAGEVGRARAITGGAIGSGVIFMSVTAVLFLVAGEVVVSAFTRDGAVIALGAQLLIIAGIFQICDGIQTISMGALRGIRDVKTPTLIMAGVYWLGALPLGAVLAWRTYFGAVGMWFGLAIGLGLAGLLLTRRFYSQLRGLEVKELGGRGHGVTDCRE